MHIEKRNHYMVTQVIYLIVSGMVHLETSLKEKEPSLENVFPSCSWYMDACQSCSKVCFRENKLEYENKKSETKHAFDTNEEKSNNNNNNNNKIEKERGKISKQVAVDIK
jgi:hypothetical protein